MDWSRFDPRGRDHAAAFEAFTCQLFERWCRREHRLAPGAVRRVCGKGGDGGVEAYAVLGGGRTVGLQAKWFREGFGAQQIKQIEKSLRRAATTHRKLWRYVVAIPRDLTPTQRARWEEWKHKKAPSIAPGVEVLLWDEHALEAQLSERDNVGLDAYWFPSTTIPADDLDQRFKTARAGWLSRRYIADLHAEGLVDRDLALRLGEARARRALRREVEAALEDLSAVREDILRLARHASFRAKLDEPKALCDAAGGALQKLLDEGKKLCRRLEVGRPIHKAIAFSVDDEKAIRALENALRPLAEHWGPLRETREHMDRVLWEHRTPQVILDAWKRWQRAANLATFVGPPGVGKTHGLAHVVEKQLLRGQPALLLRARDCRLEGGWEDILRRALDRPGQPLSALLNGLEAAATLAEVWRLRDGKPAGPVYSLIAVDGLEESGDHRRWSDLLGELSVHLARHPRLRAAVTLRTAAMGAILSHTKPETRDIIRLPNAWGETQELLARYCERYEVPLPARRVRWAIRDPLGVRLYCELYPYVRGRSDLSLPALLGRKIDLAEDAIRSKVGGFGECDHPLRHALEWIAAEHVRRGAPRRAEAIDALSAAQEPRGLLQPGEWGRLLDEAAEHGLLLLREEPRGESPLDGYEALVEPAYEPLTDHLLARASCGELRAALARDEAPSLPEALRQRPDALEQAVLLLAEQGVDVVAQAGFLASLSLEHREELQLRAIASLENEDARRYEAWVRERLVASMPSCRRVLAHLCVPVSRDASHPFAPRFVHEALLPFLPAKRDLFWSGPSYLPGDGRRPWQGEGPDALEEFVLEPEDRADGPPLLLAWALTSVEPRRRRRLRAELAKWAGKDLDELRRWLDLAMVTNDPQMAEDVAMVAFGAACLAGADPRLESLAAWADENLLAPGAKHRREDVVVLHAARGIVERARAMGIRVTPAAIEHARRPYREEPPAPPIELKAAGHHAGAYGVSPIHGDFGWEVAGHATDGVGEAEKRTGRWTYEGRDLTPLQFAFGALAAHVLAAGWNEADFAEAPPRCKDIDAHGMDWAIRLSRGDVWRYYRDSTQMVSEKYVLTGCRMLHAYFATIAAPDEAPIDPALFNELLPNPASDRDTDNLVPWRPPFAKAISPAVPLTASEQHLRASEFVRFAPDPDPALFTRVSLEAAPVCGGSEDWIVLRSFVLSRERNSQADTQLHTHSLLVPQHHAPNLRQDLAAYREGRRRNHPSDGIHDFREAVRGAHGDPFEAVWAPWATGENTSESIHSTAGRRVYEAIATTARLTWVAEDGERHLWLPAHWIRAALGLVDADRLRRFTRRDPGEEWHDEWHFRDRRGEVHSIYVYAARGREQQQALLIKPTSLRRVLAGRRLCLAWEGWLYRALTLWLRPNPDPQEPWDVERDWKWIAVETGSDVRVEKLPGWGAIRRHDSHSTPEPLSELKPASSARVGPTDPELATKLSTTLGDDDIPYFLWDDPMTVAELRRYLATASPPERDRMLGKILREARDTDVWLFTTPREVATRFDALARHLGQRRAFWSFLLGRWEKEGLLVKESA